MATRSRTISPLDKGLFTEGAFQYPPSVVNESLPVSLTQLVPKPGGEVIADNAIDHWLSRNVPGAVRLFCGRGPGKLLPNGDWLSLGAVTVHDPYDGVTATVCRWWTPDVQAAQKDAIAKLAAKYDGKIKLIFIANGCTVYAEPFIRGIASPDTRHSLLSNGYTPEADKQSYVAGYEMFKAFRKTRLAQAFNPWQYVSKDGLGHQDVSFTIEMIDKFCAMFPRRAVIQNNSIRDGGLGPNYKQMYDHMKELHDTTGRAVRYQTATKPRVGSFVKILEWALVYGACAVELSPGFQNASSSPYLTTQQLHDYDAKLRAVGG